MDSVANFDLYIKSIGKVPLLSVEEENHLLKLCKKGDIKAKNKLIESNLRLVVNIVYRKRSKPFFNKFKMDLIQEGNIGLIKAVEKFDTSFKVKFNTYAAFWIEQHVSRAIQNKQRMIRLPVCQEELLSKILRTANQLRMMYSREPTIKEIATALNKPIKKISELYQSISDEMMEVTFTEEAINSDNFEFKKYHPEREVMKNNLHQDIESLLSTLTDREHMVIKLRYAFGGYHKHTLKETGAKLRVSPETIRKVEKTALDKLKTRAHSLKDYNI